LSLNGQPISGVDSLNHWFNWFLWLYWFF